MQIAPNIMPSGSPRSAASSHGSPPAPRSAVTSPPSSRPMIRNRPTLIDPGDSGAETEPDHEVEDVDPRQQAVDHGPQDRLVDVERDRHRQRGPEGDAALHDLDSGFHA